MKRPLAQGVAAAAMVLMISGCASPAPAADVSPTPTPTTSTAHSGTPTPRVVTPSPTPTAIDRTYEVNKLGGGIVSKAIEDPIGTISIFTNVAQPYSAAQETSRYEAIIACEAVRAQLNPAVIRVLDASEVPFVFYNGTNYPECGLSR